MTPWGGELYLLTFLVTLGAFVGVWLVSGAARNAGLVDIYWGPGFAVIAAVAYFAQSEPNLRGGILALCAALWGLRLGFHLFIRNVFHHSEEDKRYAAMRAANGGKFFWRSLTRVFLLQAIIMWVVSLPLQTGQFAGPQPALGLLDFAGIGLFAFGLLFETIGDWQLSRFVNNPENAGKVMDRGLWAWSRHPNYFGEVVLWWGIFLIGLSGSGAWWLILSPIIMTFLLLRVSGVTLLEKGLHKSRPGYEDYVRRTSPFIPWPPKKN